METAPSKPAPTCPHHPDTPMEFIETRDGREWFECGGLNRGRPCSCAINRPLPEPVFHRDVMSLPQLQP